MYVLKKNTFNHSKLFSNKKNICPKNKICTYVENKYNVKKIDANNNINRNTDRIVCVGACGAVGGVVHTTHGDSR